MTRIGTALKSYAGRCLEAMAYADPSGLGYYPMELIQADTGAARAADTTTPDDTVPARHRQPVAAAA